MSAAVRPLRRTLLAYICAWCGCQYAHAWKAWTGAPTEDDHGICMKCSLVQLQALNEVIR